VWRFVRRLTVSRPEVVVRVEVEPGAEAQVDFGYAGLLFDPATQKARRAWLFVMALSWSRQLIATHSRAAQPGQRQTELIHLPPEKVAGLTLTPQACQERAARIGPNTAAAIAALLVDRLRAARQLLTHAETREADRLECACARALAFGDVSVRTLRNMLKNGVADGPQWRRRLSQRPCAGHYRRVLPRPWAALPAATGS
jgi:hypothetical protein